MRDQNGDNADLKRALHLFLSRFNMTFFVLRSSRVQPTLDQKYFPRVGAIFCAFQIPALARVGWWGVGVNFDWFNFKLLQVLNDEYSHFPSLFLFRFFSLIFIFCFIVLNKICFCYEVSLRYHKKRSCLFRSPPQHACHVEFWSAVTRAVV